MEEIIQFAEKVATDPKFAGAALGILVALIVRSGISYLVRSVSKTQLSELGDQLMHALTPVPGSTYNAGKYWIGQHLDDSYSWVDHKSGRISIRPKMKEVIVSGNRVDKLLPRHELRKVLKAASNVVAALKTEELASRRLKALQSLAPLATERA